MNKCEGGNFDDFLAEEGILEEVTERALKRLLALEIEGMVNQEASIRIPFFEKISTDLVELNHYLFDLDNTIITSELLESFIHEAKEMRTDPVQLNDPLFYLEYLLNYLLTEST